MQPVSQGQRGKVLLHQLMHKAHLGVVCVEQGGASAQVGYAIPIDAWLRHLPGGPLGIHSRAVLAGLLPPTEPRLAPVT